MSATITVRVQARARREELAGLRDGAVVVRVSAPALEGRANRAVCKLLAARLGVAPSHVRIIRGEHHRDKVVQIDGIDQATAEATLSG